MPPLNRRQFMNATTKTAVAAGVSSAFSINVLGANERVRLGFMGTGGRGQFLADCYAKRDSVDIVSLADADSNRSEECANKVEKITGKRPQVVSDFRKILEDKEVDALVNATPDHWHALGTILACQAGKDVYVEKPTSHSIWESRKMIEAARKYNRIVQVGAQSRSAPYMQEAIQYLREGSIGDIHYAKVWNSKLRNTIGKIPDSEVPAGVDYDMWLGPAPMRPFNMNHFHYNWNWFWVYSGGDISNDGVHQTDLLRWCINKDYPKSVYAIGGIFFYDDDQQTPDTHVVVWEYDDMTAVFEQQLWAPYMRKTPWEDREKDFVPDWPFNGTKVEVFGTKQKMNVGRHGDGFQVFDETGKPIHFSKSGHPHEPHIDNFLECVKSRKLPNSDIEELHKSTLLCHYGNIAYRLGRKLFIDPKTEGFIDDDEANQLVRREYRSPWVVPEVV